MHDPAATGTDMFVCDFCSRPWADDRPMVEGHRGSLVCAGCLSAAYTEVALLKAGVPGPTPADGPGAPACTMCLERRPEPHWVSPIRPEARVCRRCIKQSATTMEKDPETGWKRPVG